jgi:predicted transglutaminase-like cysteine proteinase
MAIGACLILVLALAGSRPAGAATPPLFGTQEVPSNNLKPFPKWTDMLKRFAREGGLPNGDCHGGRFNRCYLRDWLQFLDKLKGADQRKQIEEVNRYVNQSPYITDLKNYGVDDYWATPKEFYFNSGDCEDYSIAKYMSLRALGLPASQLRLVVLQDLNLRVAHAVLAAFVDDKGFILDNQLRQVVDNVVIRHYKPFYSINEDGWWLHKK